MTILIAQQDQKVSPIPEWVVDLESFRRWARSEDFPTSGWYSHLNGDLWVDANMERLTHNRLKTAITSSLDALAKATGAGILLGDRMLLTNVDAGLSTEPDAMFLRYETIQQRIARLDEGDNGVEVVGTPDLVIEIVSPTSGRKDKIILREIYHRAGIREYWIVEPRDDSAKLEILVSQPDGYSSAAAADGWALSQVFGKAFLIYSSKDPIGCLQYELKSR